MHLDHFAIVVSDLKKSKNFYQKIFKTRVLAEREIADEKFAKIMDFPEFSGKFAVLALPFSEIRIELLQFITHAPAPQKSELNHAGFRHFAIRVDDADAIFREIEATKLAEFIAPPKNNGLGKKMCYFRGPDREIWEIAEYL